MKRTPTELERAKRIVAGMSDATIQENLTRGYKQSTPDINELNDEFEQLMIEEWKKRHPPKEDQW